MHYQRHKFNKGKRPDQIIFATQQDVQQYVDEAREAIAGLEVNHRTDGKDIPLMDGLSLRTYKIPHENTR